MGHFFSRISLITLVPFDPEQPYVGRGVFLGVSNAVPQGAGPKRNPILGVTSIYAYTLWRRTTKFDVVTHMGRLLAFKG